MRLNSINRGNESRRQADLISADVIATVDASPARLTPAALQKQILARHGLNKRQSQTIIRNLVFSGELTYTYEFGSSFLERSFTRPVRISKHVVLSPPDRHCPAGPKDVVVQIKPGASFGNGRHPTTRLAIRALEFVLLDGLMVADRRSGRVLDIGTGSGVLILTAVRGGMDSGLGIDIDPCARTEAAENVKINGLEDRIVIAEHGVDALGEIFSMVLANLRYPSLMKLSSVLTGLIADRGVLVFSGIKSAEVDDLLAVYTENRFECLWRLDELGWAGIVLRKTA